MPRKAATTTALEPSAEVPRPNAPAIAFQALGAARYASYINAQTKADIVRFLINVRDEKQYLEYEFASFDEFLESGLSPMAQRTFYRELDLFLTEGDQYELFNELRIPATVRRQLMSGDVTIDGDHAVVGEQRIPLNDGIGVKKLVE